MNQFIISGRVTGEVVERETKNGEKFAVFNMVWNKGKDENQKATFFQVSAFGKTGEFVKKNFKKGSSVEVAGELDISVNEKDGKVFVNNRIIANTVGFYGFSTKKEETK